MSYTPPPPPAGNQGGSNDTNIAVIAHLGTLINLISGLGFIVPLVILLTKGRDSQLVRANAAESLNFQISMIIYALVGGILTVTFIFAIVGIPILIVIVFLIFILPIVAAVRTSNGQSYRYPATLRLIK
ncbi:MAG: DUF4870 domain-containing protein [Candidatus Nanopelagicales bacterium]